MEKILVLGGTGLVGSRFVELSSGKFDLVVPAREDLDLFDVAKLDEYLNNHHPQTVLNCVGFTNVDSAEAENGNKDGQVFGLNCLLPQILSSACIKSDSRLIHISTDYVFDGKKLDVPYTEGDEPGPLNWYGQTKWQGDQALLESGSKHVIARISMPYTASFPSKKDIARTFLERLQTGQPISAICDQKITPNYADALIEALTVLITKPESGIFNLASIDWTTPYDFARLIALTFSLDERLVTNTTFDQYQKNRPTPRPQNSWLDISRFEEIYGKGILLSNQESIERFKKQVDSAV